MRTHYSREITPDMDGKRITLSGWVFDTRLLGSLAFVILRDREGSIQAVVKKDKPELFSLVKGLHKEDVILLIGTVKASKEAPGGVEIVPEKIDVISPSQVPLPLDVSGKITSEFDTRLNARFMDLRQPKVRAIFMLRNHMLTAIRDYMDKEGFVEVHTPKIVKAGAEGGSTLFKLKFFDNDAYLAQSPQLFKQSLMATGLDRVYEIAPAFRAEASDTIRHVSEFISFDVEMAFIKSMEDVMRILEGSVAHCVEHLLKHGKHHLDLLGVELKKIKTPVPRITCEEAGKLLEKEGKGLTPEGDLDTEAEKLLGKIMAEKGHECYFITHYPESIKPFYYMVDSADPSKACTFDFDLKGMEMSSGGQREHDYNRLTARMKSQGLKLDDFKFYLDSFKYGMPPHGGFGIGFDRLVQKLLDLPNIREAILFPRDRSRIVP